MRHGISGLAMRPSRFHVETQRQSARRPGQPQPEQRAPRGRLELERPAHHAGELARDRQAESAAGAPAPRPGRSGRRPREVLRRDARAVVGHLERDGPHPPRWRRATRACPAACARARSRRAPCRPAARAARRRAPDRAAGGVDDEQPPDARRAPRTPRQAGCDLGEAHVDPLDAEPTGVEAREVEQLGRELRQPLNLVAHRRQEARARLVVEVLVARSSRKPPSENSGVRSSCEALAMNSRRAWSSCASRNRMRSNEARELPDLVVARGQRAARRSARRRCARPRAPAGATAAQRAGQPRTRRQRRDEERSRLRDQEPLLDDLQGQERIGAAPRAGRRRPGTAAAASATRPRRV